MKTNYTISFIFKGMNLLVDALPPLYTTLALRGIRPVGSASRLHPDSRLCLGCYATQAGGDGLLI